MPDRLGEAEIRLQVQPDGTLRAADFFVPYNAQSINGWDADVSSGAPIALPPVFGAGTSTPNLLFQVGKQGRIYLIDRDALGGYKNGAGGGDGVVAAIDGNEGVWARAAVWPGDGGYLWMPTASGGPSPSGSAGHLVVYRAATVAGRPTLSRAGASADAWPYSSSGPVITSNGTTSGSAIVWLVKSNGAELGNECAARGIRGGARLRRRRAALELGHVHLEQVQPARRRPQRPHLRRHARRPPAGLRGANRRPARRATARASPRRPWARRAERRPSP